MTRLAPRDSSPFEVRSSPLLSAVGLEKTYRLGDSELRVLRGVGLAVERGEWLAIVGRSGSGKSTLLHLLGGLDEPDAGRVTFGGVEVTALHRPAVDRYRRESVGFVFQFYHLLPELSAEENVLIAAMVRHGAFAWPGRKKAARERARALLDRVGLDDRRRHKPAKLSGGERQRVAIARALVNGPELLLADEPTGNLDAATGGGVVDLLASLHDEGQTIVMVTHDDAVAARADRTLVLREGALED